MTPRHQSDIRRHATLAAEALCSLLVQALGCTMPLVFCDETDAVRVVQRDVFVYVCMRLAYSTYEEVERSVLALKRQDRLQPNHEIEWTKDRSLRKPFLEMTAGHAVEIFYYVVPDKRSFSRPDRYRYKTLLAAFRSLSGGQPPTPVVFLDTRSRKQDSDESRVLEYPRKEERLAIPAYSYHPSESVIGLQLADLAAGALRLYEAEGNEEYYSIIRRCVKDRVEIGSK